MATSTALIRAREHIDRLSRRLTDATTLRVAVLDELRHTIGFDAHVWLMTDPRTWVGSAPLAEVPSTFDLPTTIRLKYLSAPNRWTDLAATASLAGQGHAALPWIEHLTRHGIGDVASSRYADRFGCWGFLDLWRLERSGPFDAAELRFLDSIAMTLTTALRGCVAATFVSPAVAHARELGPIVLVLDNDLVVRSQTAAGEEWLGQLLPAAHGQDPVPASAYNVAAQLLAHEAAVDQHQPMARVHLGQGFWVTVRAARLDTNSIAVTLEESSPQDRRDLYARASRLTARETELLGHLATGGDTHTIAGRMSVSENTVQDHLKAVFDKTGARNRVMLLGRALGVAST